MPSQALSVDGLGVQYWIDSAYPDKEDGTGHGVSVFENGETDLVTIPGVMLPDYVGGTSFDVYVHWASWTATVGSCRWRVEFERLTADGNPTNALNFGTAKTVDSVASSTLSAMKAPKVTFTAAEAQSIAAGDAFRCRIARLGADGADTLAGLANLFRIVVDVQ